MYSIDGEFRNRERLKKLKGIHTGKRCFILGTGPSLNNVDFSLIRDEVFIGCNGLLSGYNKFGINCQYYGCSDGYTFTQFAEKMLKLDTTLFIGHGAVPTYYQYLKVSSEPDTAIIVDILGYISDGMPFTYDLQHGTSNGGTVLVDLLIPIACYLGLNPIYLLGADCDYSVRHHFDDYKNQLGKAKQVMGDWTDVFKSYKAVKEILDERGVSVINVTDGSKLDIFTKKKLEDII